MQMGRKKRSTSLPAGKTKQREGGFDTRLATILLAKGLVAGPEESVCLAESIAAEIQESELSRNEACIASLEDYFFMSRQTAMTTLSSLLDLGAEGEDNENENEADVSSEEAGKTNLKRRGQSPDDDSGDNDDGEYLYVGEGECELCERFIRLTQHHLIPRSTWPRILPRLTNAAEALSKNDVNRAALILGAGLAHMLEPLTTTDSDKAAIKELVRRTCNICGPCHAHIHRTHENMALATNYSTIELLLKDEKIHGFCKWASKQKAGRYSYSHSM
jgi:hypothetical protein